MVRHPVSSELLLAYAGGELGAAEGGAVAAHVTTCPDCAATVARYGIARSAVADPAWAPVPVAAMSAAKGLFARFGPLPAVAERPNPLAALRRLVATITFDSAAGLGLAGARGPGDAYTLIYSSDAAEVELQVEPFAGGAGQGTWQIMGQITPREPVGDTILRVGLVTPNTDPGDAAEWSAVDEHGYFSLVTPPGRYDVLITLPSLLLSLPALDIGGTG